MKLDRITIENDEEYLRQISTPVDFEKDDYLTYIEMLKEYCASNAVFALAPVQIGIPKRIIYIKNASENMENNFTDGYSDEILYINPKIISIKGHTKFLEGCESCMYVKDGEDIHYVGLVDRPYMIEIEYYDINGNKCKKTIKGFEATVFSHEFDHLDGILHIDKVKDVMEMTLEEMRKYRTENPYQIISKDSDDLNIKMLKKVDE